MKKLGLVIFSVLLFIVLSVSVSAASATIGVSVSASQVVEGKSVTVTVTVSSAEALGSWEYVLNYDTSLFTLTSTTPELHVMDYVSGPNTKKVSYKYTFKAKKSGSGSFYINASNVAGWDEKLMSVTNGSRSVKVITQQQLQESYSKNNNLASLSVEGYELDVAFNKDVLEYNVTVPPETSEITINAAKEDSKASVSGGGEHDVTLGLNKFVITVTAQNGNVKKYVVNVTVEELEPIEVSVGGKVYTVVRQSEALEAPLTYVPSTTFIDGEEVPALYCELVDNTLIGLKDEAGTIELYSYDEVSSSYVLYQELKFKAFNVVPKEYDKEIDGYVKKEIEINGVLVNAFVREGDEKQEFFVIYGMNTESGKSQLYEYDSVENTLQRFVEGDAAGTNRVLKNYMMVIGLFGFGLIVAMIIIVLLLCSKPKKRKVKRKEEKRSDTDSDNDKSDDKEVQGDKEEGSGEQKENEMYDIFEDDRKRKKK